MPARQIRVNNLKNFSNRLEAYQGKKINIVLKNKEVIFGYLSHIAKENLELINLSKRKLSFKWQEIDEILIDN